MDEPRRFLRYVVPGLVLLVELWIYLWFSEKCWNWVRSNLWISPDSTEKLLGVAIAAVFVSGGIGYILGAFYHTAIAPYAFNYTAVVSRLEQEDIGLKVVSPPVHRLFSYWPSWRRNWTIVTALWHSRRETSERIKGATPRADSLTDPCVCAGATTIGSAVAMSVAFSVQAFGDSSGAAPAVFWIAAPVLLVFHALAFCRVNLIARDYIAMILLQEMSVGRQEAMAAIRKRAHKLWEKRGRLEGTSLEDWLQAKAELPQEAARMEPVLTLPR